MVQIIFKAVVGTKEAPTTAQAEGTLININVGETPVLFVIQTKLRNDDIKPRLAHFASGYCAHKDLRGEQQKIWIAKGYDPTLEMAASIFIHHLVEKNGATEILRRLNAVPQFNKLPEDVNVATTTPQVIENPRMESGETCSCPECEGTGQKQDRWSKTPRMCLDCYGAGMFRFTDGAELQRILDLIISSRGPRKGKLKSSWSWKGASTLKGVERVTFGRAYYVWRWARFNGGEDVTMPMMAGLECRHDPFKATLDAWAADVAKRSFGTDLAGGKRWHDAFYGASR